MSRTNKTFDTAPHAFTGTGRSRIIPRPSRPGGGAPRGASCGRVPARALRLVNFYALSANLERHLTSRRRSCDPELGGWVDLTIRLQSGIRSNFDDLWIPHTATLRTSTGSRYKNYVIKFAANTITMQRAF